MACSLSLADLQNLAINLGSLLPEFGLPALLLYGPMGSGKTTFTSCLVNSFPGAENAQVSSPSFTAVNWYYLSPAVCHCDLFRCKSQIPEDLLEALEDENILAIVEWSEYLPNWEKPENYLDIRFTLINGQHAIELRPYGSKAGQLCKKLRLP